MACIIVLHCSSILILEFRDATPSKMFPKTDTLSVTNWVINSGGGGDSPKCNSAGNKSNFLHNA